MLCTIDDTVKEYQVYLQYARFRIINIYIIIANTSKQFTWILLSPQKHIDKQSELEKCIYKDTKSLFKLGMVM